MRWFAFVLGAVLIAVAILAFLGFEPLTTREIADFGPIEVTKQERVPLGPVLGVVGLAAGLALLAVGAAATREER